MYVHMYSIYDISLCFSFIRFRLFYSLIFIEHILYDMNVCLCVLYTNSS